ncbi:MAG: M1 family metallopeptidase [Candidatus Aminicenantes bacterium]
MKKEIVFIIMLALPLCTGWSMEEPFCPQTANYSIDVTLNTNDHTLNGTEILEWTNTSQIPAGELWFHLYWNAFQNNRSDFLTEGRDRWGDIISRFQKEDWGYCRIKSIVLIEKEEELETDLMDTFEFRQPDNDNIHEQTVFTVQLPEPVEPGETIRLRIRFSSKVPTPIHRTGVYKDYYFIAQWFPKIGVLYEGKWNCHQFHATTNFFADYGTYDVKITLPSRMIVGATGEHTRRVDHTDGTSTHSFFQHSVHDFAWTASPDFIEVKEYFEFAPGKRTEITLLLQPYHKHLKKRYMQAVKNSLIICSRLYGDYPYSTVTCVDPAYNSRSGGMEYPTFFTGGAYFLTHPRMPSPEGVTIHEFGHNYFYGLVGTNEFENAWMDEGFTSFLDSEVYYAAYPPPLFSRRFFNIPVVFPEVEIPIESSGISRHRQTSRMDIMQLFTWQFMNRSSYGANSYSKAELMLRSLKRFLGPETYAEMIKAYSTRNWFKHPRPEDFYSVVSEFAGGNLSWLLDQFIYGSGELDYAVEHIRNRRITPLRGWSGEEFHSGDETETPPLYESEVLVRRLGEVQVPVEVLIIFEDGLKKREMWDGKYRRKRFKYRSPVKIRQAVVDPDFIWVIDICRTNNSRTSSSPSQAALKWTSRWMVWLQHAMEFFTLLGG